MKLLLTNVPAVYRKDLYEVLTVDGWKIFFYDRRSTELKYCSSGNDLSFPYEDTNLSGLFARLVSLRPDIIISVGASLYTLVCCLYSLLFRKRMIVWWAGTRISESGVSVVKKIARGIIFSMADDFIVYSEHAERYLLDFGISKDKIVLLGNMTFDAYAYFDVVEKERRGLGEVPLTILTVGNMMDSKNHMFLLEVYRLLLQKYRYLRLLIVGDGPERGKIERFLEKNGLDQVYLLGHVSHKKMLSIYAGSTVYMHTAKMDRWPQSANEAMSAGVPVIATLSSGLSETLLVNGKDLIVRNLDVNEFVESFVYLIENPDEYATMAKNALIKMDKLYKGALEVFDNLG